MKRRLDSSAPDVGTNPHPPAAPSPANPYGLTHRLTGPQTREEVEEIYVAARDAWTAAMRAANSGRSADLASLAIAQEAYELAAADRERWLAGGDRIAIPVEPADTRHSLETAVGQELAWRRVLHPDAPQGRLARIRRRITGR